MNAFEHFSTEFNDNSPIYKQIIALFSHSFVRGEIKTGERIPSIRDMATRLKVNANTMQRVYQEMERAGMISSRRGTGYFFTEDKGMVEKVRASITRGAMARFIEEMRELGFSNENIIDELKSFMKGEKENGAVTGDIG
jgi:GntR family transcriptional regulator